MAQDETNCTITFTPDAAWLNAAERVYPITIDPQNNQNDGANYDDTYVHVDDNVSGSNGACTACGVRHNKQDRMYVGIRQVKGVYKKHRSFLRIKDMPALTPGSTIKEAQLTVWYTDNTSTGREIGLYKNLGGWNNDSLTWNNQPSWYKLDEQNFNKEMLTFSGSHFLSGIRMMYSGEANNGFMLCYESESMSNPDYNAFYTSNSAVAKRSERPLLQLTYQEPASIADGVYFIRNRKSGHYLTIPGNGGSETQAVQYAFNGNTNQQWKVTRQADGYYKLQPMYNTGLALDVRGGAPIRNGQWVETYGDNNGPAQRWAFFANGDGTYRLMPKVGNQAMCLNVAGASQDDWANVILYGYNGKANCVW